MSLETQHDINQMLERGARQYFAECRSRVDDFVDLHFCYPGAWNTNRVGLGWDLLRAPLNIIWAPAYVLIQLLVVLLRGFRINKLAACLSRLPAGMTTDVQRYLADKMLFDLLAYRPSDDQRASPSKPSRLGECLGLSLINSISTQSDMNNDSAQARQELLAKAAHIFDDALIQYSITRNASADIGNSLLSSLIGVFAFQKFTPGGMAIGFSLAAWWAQKLARDHFIFGETLGGLYYSWFPATPSLALSLASVMMVLIFLAFFASFSGLISDPVQASMGFHKRRLNKMIDHLEADFMRKAAGGFRPKDQYFARLLEILDAAKAQLG